MPESQALLLIGHGSERYPDAGRAMRRHADALRSGDHFTRIEVAMLNGAPPVAEALGRIGNAPASVVPFFMEDGYFSRIAVPKAVAAVRRAGCTVCPPVGVHDGMAGIVERQALAACGNLGIPKHAAAVVIIGHGSASAPGRALALHRHASRAAATSLFARVEPACLEEPPFVPEVLRSLRRHPTVVIGFFANHGGHVRDDVPALIAAEQAARGDAGLPVRFHGCVADDPSMANIILDQARAGEARA